MRIEQLYYVIESVKTGSFTKAANNLFLKQPGLRAAISALEEELGFKIFIRSAKGVVLTSQGERALPVFKNMVKEYELLKKNVIQNIESETKSLDISVALAGEQIFFQPSFNMMRVVYSDVKLNVLSGNSYSEQLQWLLDGKIDVAIMCVAQAVLENNRYYYSQKDHAYTLEKISSYDIKFLALDSHPLAVKRNLSLEDLCQYTFMFRASGDKPIEKYLEKKIKDYKKVKHIYLSNQAFEAQYIFEENGIYCCLDNYQIDTITNNPEYIALDLEEKMQMDFYLAYRVEEENPMVMIYADMIRKLAQQQKG